MRRSLAADGPLRANPPSSFLMYLSAKVRPVSLRSTMRTLPKAPLPTTRSRRKWLRFTAGACQPGVVDDVGPEAIGLVSPRTLVGEDHGLAVALTHGGLWDGDGSSRMHQRAGRRALRAALAAGRRGCGRGRGDKGVGAGAASGGQRRRAGTRGVCMDAAARCSVVGLRGREGAQRRRKEAQEF